MDTTRTRAREGRKLMQRSLVALAVSLAIAGSAHAGSVGGMGGALEITQLANQAELMHQTAETVNQTAMQINQLTTMLQNLRSLGGLAAISQTMGIPLDGLNSFIELHGGVHGSVRALTNLERSLVRFERGASQTASFYGNITDNLGAVLEGRQSITAADMNRIAREMTPQRRARLQQTLEAHITTLRDMEREHISIQESARQIPQITGNVQGFQFLASQNTGIQRLLADNQAATRQLAMEMSAERLEQAEREEVNHQKNQMLMRSAISGALF